MCIEGLVYRLAHDSGHFDIDRDVYYALYILLPLLVGKGGWIEFRVLFLLH